VLFIPINSVKVVYYTYEWGELTPIKSVKSIWLVGFRIITGQAYGFCINPEEINFICKAIFVSKENAS